MNKKTDRKAKLRLSKETIVLLGRGTLRKVVGGSADAGVCSDCTCHGAKCGHPTR